MEKITLQRIVLAALLSGLAAGAQAARRLPDASATVAQIEAKVEQGGVDPARDLAPLVDGLRAAKDERSQSTYIDAIEELGDFRGSSPAAVKAWLVANAPPALLEVARSNAGWSVRGDALMALRTLDAPDAVLDEAIAIARAATGDGDGFIHSRGDLLQDWKENRERSGSRSAAARPQDPQKEQAALQLLRSRGRGASDDDLGRALGEGDAEIVQALIDAGVDVASPGDGPLTPLGMATMLACAKHVPINRQLAVLDLLIAQGADVNHRDAQGNTVLIAAVQQCPLAVFEKLVAAGAEPNPVNAQQFTPLKMAMVAGRWDIAEFLVGKGARMSAKDADQLFMEKPQDPAQAAILRRATGAAK
ncbi:MAG TPA: ankyrin repeat domain-containing protein [Tahibacter sp.]|uniref:ankyrin repeat domain-containing protein n=1 Tax=Tahibacter sp. TaxID=2056211 RepID=UPI002C2C8A76|nr:ankyrin repeat domain-containing protein [Tahibacter sp.]HSX60705.1 ankyrin repeat domain-containing protein [Tahibacter sp.]